MKDEGIISGVQYFDTKLHLSHNLYSLGVNIKITESIMNAIHKSIDKDGVFYYTDEFDKIFYIIPGNAITNFELVGPIYQRMKVY